MYTATLFFYVSARDLNLGSLCLHSMDFTHWAISPMQNSFVLMKMICKYAWKMFICRQSFLLSEVLLRNWWVINVLLRKILYMCVYICIYILIANPAIRKLRRKFQCPGFITDLQRDLQTSSPVRVRHLWHLFPFCSHRESSGPNIYLFSQQVTLWPCKLSPKRTSLMSSWPPPSLTVESWSMSMYGKVRIKLYISLITGR